MPRKKRNRRQDAPSARQRELRKSEKQERDKQICYKYARCRNASQVGKEFGVSHVYVLRAWKRLSDDERAALLDTRDQVDEELNRKLIQAERIGGDKFIADLVRAREFLGQEILKRCTGTNIHLISNKDLTSLARLVVTVTSPDQVNDTKQENETLRAYRQSIREQIDKPQH